MPSTTTVQLDRPQREAIRAEIALAASQCSDVEVCLADDKRKRDVTDRGFLLSMSAQIRQWVAALDAIGWEEEADDAVTERPVRVDWSLAEWAQKEVSALERCFTELHVENSDLDALSGFRVIAEAVA
jgi:hypothetical protein